MRIVGVRQEWKDDQWELEIPRACLIGVCACQIPLLTEMEADNNGKV